VQYDGRSDVGLRRSSNQDRWGADAGQCLFIVADGVAGSRDGGLAAEMVTELLPGYVAHQLPGDTRYEPDAAERFAAAVGQLSDDLHAQAETDPRIAGAATTVVAFVIAGPRALVAHLGDSRAYLYRDAQLHLLTRDHTLIQKLIDAQQVEIANAADHPARSVLTRNVAMNPPAKADGGTVDLQPGDRLLLCSDGLHGVVDQAVLIKILGAQENPTHTCEQLIGAANAAGGPDNITVVVLDITGIAAGPDDAVWTGA
jgi:PPM family protein phosphatase